MTVAAQVARLPEVQQVERSRFAAVLLDEYQDTGHAQIEMLRCLFGDGHPVTAGALVAQRLAPAVAERCLAGHRSAERGHRAALTRLGLVPLLDLDMRLGEGSGAALALPLVRAAARLSAEMATFSSAGVSRALDDGVAAAAAAPA